MASGSLVGPLPASFDHPGPVRRASGPHPASDTRAPISEIKPTARVASYGFRYPITNPTNVGITKG